MKNSRLIAILYRLADHKKVTADELASHFEVSKRTILRDLDALLTAGFPVEVERGRTGGFFLNSDYILNRSILTKSQSQTLSSLVQTLKIHPSGDSSLDGIFKGDGWFEYDFSGWAHSDRRIFTTIRDAIQNQIILKFVYYNSRGEKRLREVLPKKLIYKERFWYLDGTDIQGHQNRLFKLRRIMLEEHQYDIDASNTTSIKMDIDKRYLFKVLDECYIHDIIEKDDKEVCVIFSCPTNDWIYSFILSFGEYGRIVEPDYLKLEIINRIKNMCRNYELL